MGLAPQSAAKDASLRIRWGLSPAATGNAQATSTPTPQEPNSAGLACLDCASSSASRCAISAVSAWWRRARARSAVLAAAVTGSGLVSGRRRAHAATVPDAESPRSRSLMRSGAVTARLVIWLVALVRALTAERARGEHPDRLYGAVCGLGLRVGVAAQRRPGSRFGVDGVGLAAAPSRLAVRAVHLDDLDASGSEVPGEVRTVEACTLDAHERHAAVGSEPLTKSSVAGGVRVERGRAQQPSHRVLGRDRYRPRPEVDRLGSVARPVSVPFASTGAAG